MEYIKPELENIVSIMHNLTNLEFAVFNIESKLIASTDTYLKIKGRNVHSRSIQDVLSQGNVIVNKPGYMPACIGCRFVNNCPSSIEILSCIKLNNKSIGIVSLTSFSKEGHMIIENNINGYINLLENISSLITNFHIGKSLKKDLDIIHMIIGELIKDTDKNYLVIDKNGSIIYWDTEVQREFFSHCDLYTNLIEQAFPSNVVNWIFSIKTPSNKHFNIRDKNYNIYVNPIKVEKEILGYTIELDKEKKNKLKIENHNALDMIVSKNKSIKHIKDRITKISNSPSSVLITGKTGTGKEMFAKAIHYTGNRAKKPFISINCSTIPESLFESELFGYEEGAFTGAKSGGKAGIFEMANEGTLFLDEIGELPLHLQPKLLRVLQENTIRRIGSTNNIPIDVRLISATNRDLEEMVLDEKFRDDLFYRINIIPINLPTLEERMDDIELLTNHFIKKHSGRLNKRIDSISKEALKVLKSYSWPGNIRELENTIEYAVNMTDTNILIKDNLPNRIKNSPYSKDRDINNMVKEKEIDLIIETLDKNGWDLKGKEKTAKDLGISLRTLYRKLENRSENE